MRVYIKRYRRRRVTGEVLHRLDICAGQDQLGNVCMTQQVPRYMEVKGDLDIPIRNIIPDLQIFRDRLSIVFIILVGHGVNLAHGDGLPFVPEGHACMRRAVSAAADIAAIAPDAAQMLRQHGRYRDITPRRFAFESLRQNGLIVLPS